MQAVGDKAKWAVQYTKGEPHCWSLLLFLGKRRSPSRSVESSLITRGD